MKIAMAAFIPALSDDDIENIKAAITNAIPAVKGVLILDQCSGISIIDVPDVPEHSCEENCQTCHGG